jgi:hypothetical protein
MALLRCSIVMTAQQVALRGVYLAPARCGATMTGTSSPSSGGTPDKPGDDAPVGTSGTGDDICPDCQGTGRVEGHTCEACRGTGVVNKGIGGA